MLPAIDPILAPATARRTTDIPTPPTNRRQNTGVNRSLKYPHTRSEHLIFLRTRRMTVRGNPLQHRIRGWMKLHWATQSFSLSRSALLMRSSSPICRDPCRDRFHTGLPLALENAYQPRPPSGNHDADQQTIAIAPDQETDSEG